MRNQTTQNHRAFKYGGGGGWQRAGLMEATNEQVVALDRIQLVHCMLGIYELWGSQGRWRSGHARRTLITQSVIYANA
jgi:hypothetical protein